MRIFLVLVFGANSAGGPEGSSSICVPLNATRSAVSPAIPPAEFHTSLHFTASHLVSTYSFTLYVYASHPGRVQYCHTAYILFTFLRICVSNSFQDPLCVRSRPSCRPWSPHVHPLGHLISLCEQSWGESETHGGESFPDPSVIYMHTPVTAISTCILGVLGPPSRTSLLLCADVLPSVPNILPRFPVMI